MAKLYVILLLMLISVGKGFAQTRSNNGTNHKADSIKEIYQYRSDSLHQKYNNTLGELDSLDKALQQSRKIQKANHQVDSIESSFYQRTDSLKTAYKGRFSKLDSVQSRLQLKVDSLTTLKLPSNGLTQKLDSLNKLREKTSAGFEKKIQSIKDQTARKLEKLDLPPEVNDKVTAVTKNIQGANISTLGVSSSPLQKVNDLGKLNGLPNVDLNNPSLGITENVSDTKALGGVSDAKQLTRNVSQLKTVTGKVGEYSNEAEQIGKGNLGEAKNIPKVAEERAVKLSGIKEMENQTKGLEEYKGMTSKAQDSEALKKEAMEKAKKVAVNHFAGKEEQLKAAMEKVSKYKQKYSSLNGTSELSKKPRNKMHGKPLIERIVPGVAIQIQSKGENFLVDFNPYAGYRITGRIRGGLGWNQRIAYNTDRNGFSPNARIFGPRAFGEFKLSKGFSPRAEVEIMNTTVPPLLSAIDPVKREWVWGVFVGMKKEYTIYKNIKGTAMVMGRLFNRDHKSPYADMLNVRFGFEVPMKKKIKIEGTK